MKTIEIYSDVSDEAMVGSEGWGTFSASESITAFVEEVLNRVHEEYPGYSVTFHRTDHKNAVYVTDERSETDEGHRGIETDQDVIRQILSDVWQRQTWYR
jgi:hypothetical protein